MLTGDGGRDVAIATSLPPSPVSMAETLVHEFQHIKLCGLMDMLPLMDRTVKEGTPHDGEDQHPMGDVLQGVYAFIWASCASGMSSDAWRPNRMAASAPTCCSSAGGWLSSSSPPS